MEFNIFTFNDENNKNRRKIPLKQLQDICHSMSIKNTATIKVDCENEPFSSRKHWMHPLMYWTGLTNRYGQMVCKYPPRRILLYDDILDSINRYLSFNKTLNLKELLPPRIVDIKSVIWSFYLEYHEELSDVCYFVSYIPVSTFYNKIDLSNIKWKYAYGYFYFYPDSDILVKKYDPNKIKENNKHFINKYVNR